MTTAIELVSLRKLRRDADEFPDRKHIKGLRGGVCRYAVQVNPAQKRFEGRKIYIMRLTIPHDTMTPSGSLSPPPGTGAGRAAGEKRIV